ncbi:MAG: tetratricopeptide repeat protein, partial [Candidatus Wallbacteria bacterium]|nr:tetratricopeptide repeat protein [Candidatus Wallbacteria bacterium]
LVQEFEQYWHKSDRIIHLARSFFNSAITDDYHVFKVFLLSRIKEGLEERVFLYFSKVLKDTPAEKIDQYAKAVSCLLGFDYQESDFIANLKQNPRELAWLVFKAFEDYFNALTREKPYILVVENLHYADEGSINLITHLLRWCKGRLFFLVTARPEIRSRQLSFPPHKLTELTLKPLTREQVRSMIGHLLGTASPPEAFLDKIFAISSGNPFYIEEILISLHEQNIISEVHGHFTIDATGFKTSDIPTSIEVLIQSRLENMEPDVLRVLKKASVIGKRFTAEELSSLENSSDVLAATEKALEEEIIFPAAGKDGEDSGCFVFSHEIVRDILYSKLTGIQRSKLHRRMAEWLESRLCWLQTEKKNPSDLYAALCHHYDKSQDIGKMVQFALLAGKSAFLNFRLEEASGCFCNALPYLKEQPNMLEEDELVDYLETFTSSLEITGRGSEALAILDYFLDIRKFKEINMIKIFLKKIHSYQCMNDLESWEQQLLKTEDLFRKNSRSLKDSDYTKEKILESRGSFAWHTGLYKKALGYFGEALELNRRLGDEKGTARCFNSIGLCHHHLCDYDLALDYYRRAMEIYENCADQDGIARSTNNIGLIYTEKNELQLSFEYYQKSLAIHERIGNRLGIAHSYNNLGMNYLRRKSFAKAQEYFELAIDIYTEIGDEVAVAYALNNIGESFYLKGELDTALEYFQESLDIKEDGGDIWAAAYTLHNMGLVYRDKGMMQQAREQLERALHIRNEIGDRRGAEETQLVLSAMKD